MRIFDLGTHDFHSILIDDSSSFGLFFLVFDPALLMPREQFRARVSELRKVIQASRPAEGVAKVRVPGDGSMARYRRAVAAGVIQLDDRVYSQILELSA